MSHTREEVLKELFENTLWGKAPPVKQFTQIGLELGMTPDDMLWQALIPALEEVGRRFEKGEFFVPEMLIAARAMQGAMDILKPLMVSSGVETIGTFLMLTVKGDMHDIGKNLCNIMLEGAGFKVVDLGVNVAPATIVQKVQEHQPHLVGFSAFLTTTMPMFKVNIQALEEAGLRDKVKVMAGGAPVTPEYAMKAGADGYAKDASEIVRVAKRLIGVDPDAGSGIPTGITAAVNAIQDMASRGPKEH
jgi:5-methyltetrahydrofolate--homocysteine methyltransferase